MRRFSNRLVRHKTGFGRVPARGTKLRRLAILLLRGVSVEECREVYGSGYGSAIQQLINEKGYDVRYLPDGSRQIVGKYKWDGGYRSFVEAKVKEEIVA